jgi:dihydroorotase
MWRYSRRAVLKGATAIAPAMMVSYPLNLRAQTSTASPQYDLVIKGGEVIDPSQNLRARRDVAIRYARIAALEEDVAADDATYVLDATGSLVVPGLVDIHAHVYPYGSALGLPPDQIVPDTATTTYVSAGDAGGNTFSGFKRWVIEPSRSRILAFVHIGNVGLAGFPVGEMLNIDYADVELCAKTVAENQDVVVGVKVRESMNVVGDHGLEPLRRAIEAAEMAGTGARVMCHIGDAPDISQLLDLLRPGDILTHSYAGSGNNVVQDGKLLPAALEAKQRGVVIDLGHGAGSFDYTIAEPAIDQGLTPDTLGSDIHALSINTAGKPFLPWCMSKFLNLGFSLEEVVAMATVNPARALGRDDELGTLKVGTIADVSVLDLVEEPVTFVDTNEHERSGDRWLKPVATVREGVPFGRPYPMPFAVP